MHRAQQLITITAALEYVLKSPTAACGQRPRRGAPQIIVSDSRIATQLNQSNQSNQHAHAGPNLGRRAIRSRRETSLFNIISIQYIHEILIGACRIACAATAIDGLAVRQTVEYVFRERADFFEDVAFWTLRPSMALKSSARPCSRLLPFSSMRLSSLMSVHPLVIEALARTAYRPTDRPTERQLRDANATKIATRPQPRFPGIYLEVRMEFCVRRRSSDCGEQVGKRKGCNIRCWEHVKRTLDADR